MCLATDHDYKTCSKIASNVRVVGDKIFLNPGIEDKNQFCRRKLRDACPFDSKRCDFIHLACLRCGKPRHIATECSLNKGSH